MRPGLFTDGLAHLSLPRVVEWCAERGIVDLELGVGGYSPAPHLDEAAAETIAAGGGRIAALNASGNPLHPDPRVAHDHDEALRRAVVLAGDLGVDRVVAMSGCPGSGAWPVFAGGAWLPDMEGLWQDQWERIAAYWRELSGWAETEAPDVRICLELHPGTSIYNPASFALLRSVVGENVAVNLDPSHFWWQGIDPVRAVAELAGSIGFAHGKDTLLRHELIATNGLFDFAWPDREPGGLPWHFSAVGSGHPLSDWGRLLDGLRTAGYDSVVSIEHEDPLLVPEEGIETSLRALRDVIGAPVS